MFLSKILPQTNGVCAQMHISFYRFVKKVVCTILDLVVCTNLGESKFLKIWNVKLFCTFSSNLYQSGPIAQIGNIA